MKAVLPAPSQRWLCMDADAGCKRAVTKKRCPCFQNTTEELEERVEVLEVTVDLLAEDTNLVEDDIDILQIETGVLGIDLEGNSKL